MLETTPRLSNLSAPSLLRECVRVFVVSHEHRLDVGGLISSHVHIILIWFVAHHVFFSRSLSSSEMSCLITPLVSILLNLGLCLVAAQAHTS